MGELEKVSAKDLILGARKAGRLSPEAVAAMEKAGAMDQPDTPVEHPRSNTLIYVAVLADDSGSIEQFNNTEHVKEGHNSVIKALKKSEQKHQILFRTQYINGEVINDSVPLPSAIAMDNDNYTPDKPYTPLYESTIFLLHDVIKETERARKYGNQTRSGILIVTDGADNVPRETVTAKDVEHVLVDYRTKYSNPRHPNTIAFMGIHDGETDFTQVANSMGIYDEQDGKGKLTRRIITPGDEGWRIRRAFDTFSKQVARG